MKTGINRFAGKGRETSIRIRQERARRHAADLTPVIAEMRAGGVTTLQAIARALNARGIPTARGGSWSAVQVQRVLARTA
ncbi:resolvase [Methylobacterium terricola]|uniref:Resolvase n=1 Tax=Methylobacterium terricola TaxID=2583531 RepID=A0A5C4L5S1_9HYPH|nr:recombinase family protein [Methylobacterium terricola]TNC05402.1 resolvase [Methylobacterium terricola]